MKHKWHRSAVLAVVMLLLGSAVATAAQTTLTLYFQWGRVEDTLKKAVALYEERNPHIKVDIVAECIDCGTGYEKLITAIAGGTAPDLVTLNKSWFIEMAMNGALEPLNQYVAGTNWQSKYEPALWDAYSIDGKVYALPAFEGGPGRGLVYNKDILAESGVAEPTNATAMTWDELGAIARKVARYDADQRLLRIGYYPKEAGAHSASNMALAYNVDWWDDKAGQTLLDRPELVEAMEMLKRNFYDPWGYAAVEAVVKGKGMWTNQLNSLFATKGSAMMATGYWTPGELTKTMPDGNIGVTWVPNNQRLKVQTVGAWGLCMLSASKNKDEAWKLLQFLASPETTRIFFAEQGWMGGLHKDLPRYIDLRTNAGARWFVQSLEAADVVLSGKPNLYSRLAEQQWSAVYEKVVSGQGAAQPLLAEANRTVNAQIAQDRQRQQ